MISLPTMLIILTSIFSMSIKKWIMLWLALEINTVGFILMLSTQKKNNKMFIFFLFQSISSMGIMMFIFWASINSKWTELSKQMTLMMTMSIWLKMGVYPFHGWIMKMCSKISWENLIVLFSWQKLIPLMFMKKIFLKINLVILLILTMLLTSVIMIKLNMLVKILTMSSMAHTSWTMMSLKISLNVSLIYMAVYSYLIAMIMSTLKMANLKFSQNSVVPKSLKKISIAYMFSISGIPPSLLFCMKMITIYTLMKNWNMINWVVILMVFSASMSFFVYTKVFMKSTMSMSFNSKNKILLKKNFLQAHTMMLMSMMILLI